MYNKSSTLDNFMIIKTLGTGCSAKVKLGRDMITGQLYALKVMKELHVSNQFGIDKLKEEFEIVKELRHDNIGQMFGIKMEGKYTSKSGRLKSSKAYAITEYLGKCELFQAVLQAKGFDENLTRFFFKQIVSAIDYLHSRGVAHRDIKLDNIMLGERLTLKLIDFGFVTSTKSEKKSESIVGTIGYMAPELLCNLPYDAKKVDIFAMGVLLFTMYTGHPPFNSATRTDPFYFKYFVLNPDKFWALHSKHNSKKTFSENFKSLISGMLKFRSSGRFTVKDIKKNEWVNEPVNISLAMESINQDLKDKNSSRANRLLEYVTKGSSRLSSDNPVSKVAISSPKTEQFVNVNDTKTKTEDMKDLLILSKVQACKISLARQSSSETREKIDATSIRIHTQNDPFDQDSIQHISSRKFKEADITSPKDTFSAPEDRSTFDTLTESNRRNHLPEDVFATFSI
jgi:serine/threonine protein kinase